MSGFERHEPESLRLSVSVRRIALVLAVLIVVFSVLSFVSQVFVEFVVVDNRYADRIAHWLDVNAEASIPTWYATITLMACAVMLGVIAAHASRRGRSYPLQWAALAVIFGLLSLEEIIGIHSQATKVLRMFASTTEGVGYGLLLAAIGPIALALLAVVFGRFYMHLPPRWRWWFAVAGVIYIIGVIASDAIGDYLRPENGDASLAYIVVLTVEEALEMTGILIFIVMLLEYVRTFVGTVSVGVTEPFGR
jgi:MFS family permease